MDKVLTKKDIADIFQVSLQTVDEWEEKGAIKRLPKLPGHPRYSAKQIAVLADMDMDAFNPFLLKKAERENRELREKNAMLENQIKTIEKIIKGASIYDTNAQA